MTSDRAPCGAYKIALTTLFRSGYMTALGKLAALHAVQPYSKIVCSDMKGYADGCRKLLPAGTAAALLLRVHAAATRRALPRGVGVGVSLSGGCCSPQRRQENLHDVFLV